MLPRYYVWKKSKCKMFFSKWNANIVLVVINYFPPVVPRRRMCGGRLARNWTGASARRLFGDMEPLEIRDLSLGMHCERPWRSRETADLRRWQRLRGSGLWRHALWRYQGEKASWRTSFLYDIQRFQQVQRLVISDTPARKRKKRHGNYKAI